MFFGKPGEQSYISGKEAFDRQEYTKALPLLESAAKAGHDVAMAVVGYMYGSGLGVPVNYKLAKEWSEKAAEKGNADGMYILAVMYAQGTGVPANEQKAMEWLEKSAKAGNAEAKAQLAGITAADEYNRGRIAFDNRDYTQAMKLFESAAGKGHPDAMFGLGLMIYNGDGVQPNREKGIEWIKKAAESGSTQASDVMKQIK